MDRFGWTQEIADGAAGDRGSRGDRDPRLEMERAAASLHRRRTRAGRASRRCAGRAPDTAWLGSLAGARPLQTDRSGAANLDRQVLEADASLARSASTAGCRADIQFCVAHSNSGVRHTGFEAGNSLAIRLPAAVVQVFGLKEGDLIDVGVAGDDKFVFSRTPSNREVRTRLREYYGRSPADLKFDRLKANGDRG